MKSLFLFSFLFFLVSIVFCQEEVKPQEFNGKNSTINSTKSQLLFTADNTNFQYVGRIDFTDLLKPKFWNPGVYICAKFWGSSCTLVIKDQHLYSTIYNYLEIAVDNNKPKRIQTTDTINNILIAEGLENKEHTVTICKNSEAGQGYLEFLGLICDSILPPDDLPDRKIEFLGNSITCGCGADTSQIACDAGGEWYDQHSAYHSYGPVVARNLNAQYHLSSVSGYGLIRSCCGNTMTLPEVYKSLNLLEDKPTWDFSTYIPDVVTICLGQNDGIQDSTEFCSAYVGFINEIRSYYPEAQIVCLTSPMGNEELNAALKKYISSVVNYCNNKGDNKLAYYFFKQSYNDGCDYHPSIQSHLKIAQELQAYLQTLMNW